MQKYTLILILTLFLTGCYDNITEQSGTLATVNGKPILLNTVMALQEIQAPELSSLKSQKTDALELLRKQYGHALTLLIFYEVFLQELENKGVFITDTMVTAQEKIIRADYPEGEFETYLSENVVDIEAWRTLLRYGIAVKLFKEHIIRHDFVPSIDQVQDYYEKNAKNFILPERVSLYVISSEEKELLSGLQSIPDLFTKMVDKASEEVYDPLTGTLLESLTYDISAKLLKPIPETPLESPSQEPKPITETQKPLGEVISTNTQSNTSELASPFMETGTIEAPQTSLTELSPSLPMVPLKKEEPSPMHTEANKNGNQAENIEEPVIITQYKLTVEAEKLPKEWQKPLNSIAENACSEILAQGENHVRVCLEKKFPKQQLPISEAYVYIEDFLAEENWEKTIHAWLEEQLPKVKIEVSEHLKGNL